jgi:hypothetical protein
MVKIQLELSAKEDYVVSRYKLDNKLKTKADAIKKILSTMHYVG